MPYKSLNFWVFVTLDTSKENYYEDVFLEYSSSSFLKTKGKARLHDGRSNVKLQIWTKNDQAGRSHEIACACAKQSLKTECPWFPIAEGWVWKWACDLSAFCNSIELPSNFNLQVSLEGNFENTGRMEMFSMPVESDLVESFMFGQVRIQIPSLACLFDSAIWLSDLRR